MDNNTTNRTNEELEKFRLNVLNLNNSVLTSVIKDGNLHFTSSIKLSALHIPEGWILKNSMFINPVLKLNVPIIDLTQIKKF